MLFHQWNDALIIGAVRVMKVRFVHQNHGLARRLSDKVAQLVLWRNTGGRIVRIADVNQPTLRSSMHLWKIVGKSAVKRHLYHLSAISFGITENCFKRRISCDE